MVYQRRDSIARDLANRILTETGVEVVDVSLDTLTASRVVFDTLVVRLAGGSVVEVTGVEAPIEFPGFEPGYVAVGTVSITPATGTVTGESSPLAPLVRNYLHLPELFPSTALTVQRLVYPGAPDVQEIVWTSAEGFQRLHFTAAGFLFDADTERVDAESHTVTLRMNTGNSSALDADIVIIDRMGEVQINAYGSVLLPAWVPALRDAGVLPAVVDDIDGTVFGMASIRPDSEQIGRLAITLTAASDDALRLATTLGVDIDLNLPVGRPSEIRWEWPAGRWSLRSPELRLSTDVDGLEALPVRVSDLDCSDEIVCDLSAAIGPGTLRLDNLSVDRVMMTLPLEIRPGDATTVRFSREPAVFLTGARLGDVTAGAVNTLGVGDARLDIGDDGVSAALDRASINISTIAAGELRLDALALQLSELTFDEDGLRSSFRAAANSGTLAWHEFALRIPGARGRVEWRDAHLEAGVKVSDDTESLAASIDVDYQLPDGAGRMDLRDARIDFGKRSLRRWIDGIDADADIVGGTVTASGNLLLGEDDTLPQTFELDLEGLAGHYADIAATGVGGHVAGRLTRDGPRLDESLLRAALVDVGLPLENLAARVTQTGPERFDVDGLALELLGGGITSDPFTYDFGEETNRINLKPVGIQLPLMAELAGFESLNVEGKLDGGIPVMIKEGNILIDKGRLENEPPGGVIRFNADTAAAAAANANLDIASRALRNFHFDSLTSEVNYDENGDLTLSMRLSGVNPDMDPNQPIILNLNVENNVPELLRSLQAVRSIEEIIGRGTARQ